MNIYNYEETDVRRSFRQFVFEIQMCKRGNGMGRKLQKLSVHKLAYFYGWQRKHAHRELYRKVSQEIHV